MISAKFSMMITSENQVATSILFALIGSQSFVTLRC